MNKVSVTSRAKSSSLTNRQLESSRERKDWGRRSRQKIFEEIISKVFPQLMKTIKLIAPKSSMNSMKGKHKDFYTKEYHCQIAENK